MNLVRYDECIPTTFEHIFAELRNMKTRFIVEIKMGKWVSAVSIDLIGFVTINRQSEIS